MFALARYLAVAAFALFAGLSAVHADGRLELAKELMVVQRKAEAFAPLVKQIAKPIRDELKSRFPISDADLDSVVDNVIAALDGEKQDLIDQVAGVFAREFSEDELRELIAYVRDPSGNSGFLQSPTGRKIARLQPAIVKETTALGQAWGGKVGRLAGERVQEELKKRGYRI